MNLPPLGGSGSVFPNGKYSKEDMEKACFDYCQKLCTELEYWEKETQRLGCSDWWMDKEENNEVWQRRLDNIGHE